MGEHAAVGVMREIFAQAVAKGLPAWEAYIEAGHATATRAKAQTGATQWLQNPRVKERISQLASENAVVVVERMQTAMAKTGVTKLWVMEKLVEIIERSMGPKQFKGYNGATAVRALELVGKEIGMFIDRAEIGKPGEFADLSDDELELRVVHEFTRGGLPERIARALAGNLLTQDRRAPTIDLQPVPGNGSIETGALQEAS